MIMEKNKGFENDQYVQPTVAVYEFKYPLCGGIEQGSNQGEDPGDWD
jgi:hypothetical protein